MAKQANKKISKREKRQRAKAIIISMIVIGFVLTTILSIFMSGIS